MSFALLAHGDTGDEVDQFAEHHLSSAGASAAASSAVRLMFIIQTTYGM